MIDPTSISTDETDGTHCKFGEFTLKRGEKLKPKPRDTSEGYNIVYYNYAACECVLPPFITCF